MTADNNEKRAKEKTASAGNVAVSFVTSCKYMLALAKLTGDPCTQRQSLQVTKAEM